MIDEVLTAIAQINYSILNFALLILLMLVNWGCEVYKWKLLANHLTPVNWILAIKSTLIGIAASVFTPYKVGGYIGKVLPFSYRYRAMGVVLQFFNSMALFVVNFFFGLLFLGLLSRYAKAPVLGLDPEVLSILCFIGAGIVLIFWLLYVKVNLAEGVFDKLKWTKKWGHYLALLNESNYEQLAIKILGVSVFRYLIITTQYLLAFRLFGLETEVLATFFASGALFFLFQFLPVFNAVELGVTRTALFTLLLTTFGVVDGNITSQVTIVITTASFCIWLINLAIPAFVGSIYLGQVKIFKEK